MCLFCSIINHDIPTTPVYEDEKYLVINDIHPKARVHMLLIPKRHIESIADLEDTDSNLVAGLVRLARDLGNRMSIPRYRLEFNVGKMIEGYTGENEGQEVMHVHLHFLAN